MPSTYNSTQKTALILVAETLRYGSDREKIIEVLRSGDYKIGSKDLDAAAKAVGDHSLVITAVDNGIGKKLTDYDPNLPVAILMNGDKDALISDPSMVVGFDSEDTGSKVGLRRTEFTSAYVSGNRVVFVRGKLRLETDEFPNEKTAPLTLAALCDKFVAEDTPDGNRSPACARAHQRGVKMYAIPGVPRGTANTMIKTGSAILCDCTEDLLWPSRGGQGDK